MGLPTLVSRVSRGPEEQRTSLNQSIPCRFFSLDSRHSTSCLHTSTEHIPISQSVCINGLPYLEMESESLASHQNVAQRYGQEHATHQCPAGFVVWPQSALKPASGAFYNANERGGLEEWRPILTNGIVDACLACQSTARRAENKF